MKQIADPPQRVILWGLMGSGKTAAGRELARRLDWSWIDIDHEIERREGRAIAAIFRDHGEARFRQLEVAVTRDVIASSSTVFSCGGGWVTNPEAMLLIPPRSLTVWLQVAPEVAISRVGGSMGGSVRPLLATESPIETLRRLMERREPLYRRADMIVNTDTRGVHEIVELIHAGVRPSHPPAESLFPKDHGDEG